MKNKVYIRDKGKDEDWLHIIICRNPKILRLGKKMMTIKYPVVLHPQGESLDAVLKDCDNNTYVIGVMLGGSDPSHIICSIEYWNEERKRHPQRQHFCVLVAEAFDRRYLNVIHLMSLNIPIIAIRADLIKTENGEDILNFTKIIDARQNTPRYDEN